MSVTYVCMAVDRRGWLCGACGRAFFPERVHPGEICRGCGARVKKVLCMPDAPWAVMDVLVGEHELIAAVRRVVNEQRKSVASDAR